VGRVVKENRALGLGLEAEVFQDFLEPRGLVVLAALVLGPGEYCLPRHGVPF
jgi:hypothetical protein